MNTNLISVNNNTKNKTKALYTSDLHLDHFFKKNLRKKQFSELFFSDYDLCIIAGDLANFDYIYKNTIIHQISELIDKRPIIFVAGNHDYYSKENQLMAYKALITGDQNYYPKGKSSLPFIKNYFMELTNDIKNFHFLDNNSITINDINFFGGTLWSNATKNSFIPLCDNNYINSYPYSNTREMNKKEHDLFIKNLLSFLKKHKNEKNVVVSHFSPSRKLKNYNFNNETEKSIAIEKYFSCDLEYILLSDSAPSYWFYGHNHYSDCKIFNKCTALSHQSGYRKELNDELMITANLIDLF